MRALPLRPGMAASLGKPLPQSEQGSAKMPCVIVMEKRELFRALFSTSSQVTWLRSLETGAGSAVILNCFPFVIL